jgi:hypothetical protein
MKKIISGIVSIATAVSVFASAGVALAAGGHGFDQYGYNRSARVFVGTGSSWCQGKLGWSKATCDAYMGIYANDQLVMKWNAAWNACNAAGNDDESACAGASLDNEWNGMVPGGSGETEHFKAIWVGSAGEDSSYWRDGGYLIWNNYEALMDQGMADGSHWWAAHATPNGYGPM